MADNGNSTIMIEDEGNVVLKKPRDGVLFPIDPNEDFYKRENSSIKSFEDIKKSLKDAFADVYFVYEEHLFDAKYVLFERDDNKELKVRKDAVRFTIGNVEEESLPDKEYFLSVRVVIPKRSTVNSIKPTEALYNTEGLVVGVLPIVTEKGTSTTNTILTKQPYFDKVLSIIQEENPNFTEMELVDCHIKDSTIKYDGRFVKNVEYETITKGAKVDSDKMCLFYEFAGDHPNTGINKNYVLEDLKKILRISKLRI